MEETLISSQTILFAIEDASTVIGKGYRPILTRIPSDRVMAAWDVRLVKDGAPDIKVKACDYQSAADARLGENFTWFRSGSERP